MCIKIYLTSNLNIYIINYIIILSIPPTFICFSIHRVQFVFLSLYILLYKYLSAFLYLYICMY